MDAARFDRWTRAYGAGLSRRRVVSPLLFALVHGGLRAPDTEAGVGCKSLGSKCRRSSQCCAGACRGRKRKKRCRGAGCRVTPQSCDANIRGQTTFGFVGECLPRLGGGVYCASGQECFNCTQDSECVDMFGETAACIACPDECPETGGHKCAGNAID